MKLEEPVDEVIKEEIKVNFGVSKSAIENLKHDLKPFTQETSYIFIKENINAAIAHIRGELEKIIEKANRFEKACMSSPLQLKFYKSNPIVIYEFRDIYREFTENTKLFLNSIRTNIGKALSAYIVAYETLEKFGMVASVITVESDEFSCQNLENFVFRAFTGILENITFYPSRIEVITYSGVDIDDPLSLLLFGHEIFHIIEKRDNVYTKFCDSTNIQYDPRTLEAFIDIMAGLYFGPAYSSALMKHLEKRYPLSGELHPEINVRLLSLSFLQTVQVPKFDSSKIKSINKFIALIESRMDEEGRRRAQEDKKSLGKMFDNKVIEYIENYFKSKNITTYKDFLNIEIDETRNEIDKLDRNKIISFLRMKIPVATRPTTLLNTLSETPELGNVDRRLIVSSVKKWYVKRYYQKIREKANEKSS